MRTIDKEKIKKLYDADNSLKGTKDYMKYHMQSEFKNSKGRWIFYGHCVPQSINDAIIKKIKENEYLVIDNERFLMTPDVKEFLEI